MEKEYLDGSKLKEMFLAGAESLEKNKEIINALNVFPVPDGDTGTNMSLTMMAAIREIQAIEEGSVSDIAEAASKGALKGARGNSGVILSQLFRGFSKGLEGYETMSTKTCAEALEEAAKTAYKAVMKPVEGTMLTVARVTGEEALKLYRRHPGFDSFSQEIMAVAKETLDRTPDMLKPLKDAGVVDSGGMGIVYILAGAIQALSGTFDFEMDFTFEEVKEDPSAVTLMDADIEFGYCTEFLITNIFSYVKEDDVDNLKNRFANFGDSIVVVGDLDLIKVHLHTNSPGKALQLALRFGELSGIKIDNMREQHRHVHNVEMKEFAIIAVAMGDGISSIFKGLSVDYIIEGGQTMNPSIDDIIKAVDRSNAKNVFILPNNSNIILSAKQAADISDKNIIVIPSKSIPQGISAILAFNGEDSIDNNKDAMEEAMEYVKSGQVTYSVRDSENNGISIKKDDIIGILDNEIVLAKDNILEATISLLEEMIDEDSEIITILYGENIEEIDTEAIVEYVEDKYPDVDIEMHYGGQPIYYYLISVE